MSFKSLSLPVVGRALAVLAGFALLVGCGGGSSGGGSNPPASTPVISLSSTTISFSGQFVGSTSAVKSVTVSNTGSATLTFTGIAVTGDFAQTNTCGTSIAANGVCTIDVTFTPTASGNRTGTLTITDNATGSPHTVSLSGTGTSVSLSPASLTFSGVQVGQTSTAKPVTLTNTSSVALAVTSIAASSTGTVFAQTNNCGSSVAAGASCTINVTFTPAATGTASGTLTVTDNADGSSAATQTVALTGVSSGSNSVPVSVNFGVNGFSTPANSYYNGIFTTVTVCQPGTSTCTSVPNVLVDTGSTGLRVLSTALGSLANTLPQFSDGNGNGLYECTEFGSLAYAWGPVLEATVQIGGETASQVPTSAGGTPGSGIPVQLILANATAPNSAPCVASSNGAYNSVATLGANGILGVGNEPMDCGDACSPTSTTAGNINPYPYLLCSSTACQTALVPLYAQLWNPAAALPSDNNGVVLQLPSVPAGGATSVQGTMVFGIDTDNNNARGGANVYDLDSFADFQSLVFNGVTYTSSNSLGSFLDSGSNALFISDAVTLSGATGATFSTCPANGYYCVTPSPTAVNITVSGSNSVTSPSIPLSIASADTLLNSTNAALSNLGAGSGGTSASTDLWDLGLPFFLGRTIFVGISGTDSAHPNGYWAF